MQLLVSVRSASEAEVALAGGADIIDAKEPSRGSLGSVSPGVLTEIISCIPPDRPFSVALGDLTSPAEVTGAVSSLGLTGRPAPLYLKLGFAGVSSPEKLESLIALAISAASESSPFPSIVAVAYADAQRAGALPPETVFRSAAIAGAAGLLLDTYAKDGRGLLSWMGAVALAKWVARAQSAGLIAALAGGLDLQSLERVTESGADIIGVRGAACEGDREGRISRDRVRALRERLGRSGSIQALDLPR